MEISPHLQHSIPLLPILSHINPIQILPSYFSKIHFNTVLSIYSYVSQVLFLSGKFLTHFPPICMLHELFILFPSASST
jgi:hypothetical protein